jgi:hypothetical protein
MKDFRSKEVAAASPAAVSPRPEDNANAPKGRENSRSSDRNSFSAEDNQKVAAIGAAQKLDLPKFTIAPALDNPNQVRRVPSADRRWKSAIVPAASSSMALPDGRLVREPERSRHSVATRTIKKPPVGGFLNASQNQRLVWLRMTPRAIKSPAVTVARPASCSGVGHSPTIGMPSMMAAAGTSAGKTAARPGPST